MKKAEPLAFTRRDVAAFLVPAALLSQATETAPPVDDLAAARTQVRETSAQLRSFAIPIATEPSFTFRP